MKTIFRIAFAVALAMVSASCAKEEKAPVASVKSNLETVTYNVNPEALKSSLDGKTVSWTDGDKVNVFDDLGTAGLYGTITGNVLTAQVGSGATKIYVSYPYNADASFSGGTITTTLPSAQKAVAGSFDTNANLCVAWGGKDDETLQFLNAGTIVRMKVKDSDIKEVKVIGANNEAITGGADIALTGESSASGDIATTPKSEGVAYAVLNGSFTAGTEYDLCVLPQALPNGINIVLTNSASKLANKAVDMSLVFERNTPVQFGSFGGYTFSNDMMALYNAGMPIDVAGRIYRKSVDGAALEATADGGERGYEYYLLNRNAPIVFLSVANGGTFVNNTNGGKLTTSSAAGGRKDYVAISRYSDTPVTLYGKTNQFTTLLDGSLRFKNIIFDFSPSTTQFFRNTGATVDYAALHFDNCSFVVANPSMFSGYWNPSKAIESIKFVGCNFNCNNITANSTVIYPGTTTAADKFKEIVFENNVVYASAYNSYMQTMVSTYGSTSGSGETVVSVRNNIFYNTFGGNQMFKIGAVASQVNVEGNIFYYTGAPASGEIKFVQFYNSGQTATDLTVGNNLYYTTSKVRTLYMLWSNGSTITYPAENELTENNTTSPFTSFDATTGEYVLAPGFEMYGPKVKE